MVPIGNSFHKPMPGTLPTECFLYISKAKIGLTGNFTVPPPTNCSQHPLYGMSPLPIQAEMMSTWSYSHKLMPSTLSAGCFSYTSRLKWCLQELPKTSAQYAIYRTFHLHIQAEKVPMDNSHKPMPTTISTRCFSYTSRLKWCLRGTSSHKPVHSMLCTGCFSYTSRLKWCIYGTTPTNPCSLQYLLDVSLHT